MRIRFHVFLFLNCLSFSLFSQNLVPNPSFETVNKVATNWMVNHAIFEALMVDWNSPNQGSPDIIANKAIPHWRKKRKGVDLTPHTARTGEIMIGIKTYGCDSGTMHCREYIQINFSEPLRSGERYFLEFWVNPMVTSLRNNNIGAALLEVATQEDSEYGLYYLDPVVSDSNIINTPPNEWRRISGSFTADYAYESMVIGNFRTDEDTRFKKRTGDIDYAYYFIDDVLLFSLDRKEETSNLKEVSLEVGNTIQLDKVLFDLDKATLLPTSKKQLTELVSILQQNAKMQIRICGHTDNQGDDTYNQNLSEQRTQTIANYLIAAGIQASRLATKGFGEQYPLASNDTEEGRQLNRRVEFVILSNE